MGMVWEAYHKGSHYWESLESPLKFRFLLFFCRLPITLGLKVIEPQKPTQKTLESRYLED